MLLRKLSISKLFIKCNPEAFEVIAQLAVRAIKSNIQMLALFHQPSPDVSEVLTCIYTHLPCWFFPFSCMETKFLHICLKTNVENTYSLSLVHVNWHGITYTHTYISAEVHHWDRSGDCCLSANPVRCNINVSLIN